MNIMKLYLDRKDSLSKKGFQMAKIDTGFKKESELQSWANAVLRSLDIPFFHIEKGRGKNLTHRAGFPDIIGFKNGKLFAVELKGPYGKIEPAQEEWLSKLENEGAITGIVKTKNEFFSILEKLGFVEIGKN